MAAIAFAYPPPGMKRVPELASVQDTRPGLNWPVLTIVGALLLARLIYLAFACPYSLVEDEAQYWEWSKHLALSYYTKGPGIAWTIAATCQLFGDTEFGVRAAAPVFSALTTLAAAALVRAITGSRREALYAAAALQLAPILQATALLATIDGPYCACWAIAALLSWHAFVRGGRSTWAALGVALGIGFLYKYTILLLVPGLLAFAILTRNERATPRADRRSPLGPLLAVAAFFVCAAPVLIWNSDQGWPTLRHLLGHLGFQEVGADAAVAPATLPTGVGGAPRGGWSPRFMPEFVGTQVGLIGPLLFVAALAVVRVLRASRAAPVPGHDAPEGTHNSERGLLFLALCGAPILLFYLFVSLFAEPEGNWPLGGYVSLLPLAGIFAARGIAQWRASVAEWATLPQPRPRRGFLRSKPETAVQVLWHFALGYGLVSGILMLRADLLARLPLIGPQVPVARLQQGRLLAEGVQKWREQASNPGGPLLPVVASHYGRASQLAFYLPDRPVVFCASSALGGRPTQHDFWPSHDLRERRPWPSVLLIGATEAEWRGLFRDVQLLGPVQGVERKGVHAFVGTHLLVGPR